VSAYAGVGATLINFTLNVQTGQLTRRRTTALPAHIRYAAPHPALPILYVACGSGAPAIDGVPGVPGAEGQFLCAMRRDEAGDLSPIDGPIALTSRPMQLTTDGSGQHLLVSYSRGPGLTVHKLGADGTIEEELPRVEPFDGGIISHQVRMISSDGRAVLVSRGMKGFGSPSYVEGALKIVRFDQGCVENLESVSPADSSSLGGFNPRDLDLHPSRPFAFVSLEGQHKLCVFRLREGGVDGTLLFARDTLATPDNVRPRQNAGTVQVHPNGRYVYVANRNDGYVAGHPVASWLTPDPVPVFPGGENTIAVFEIDQETGEPTPIQIADSGGLSPRTFGLDPTGQILVVGNLSPTILHDGASLTEVPANLAVFRIGQDGRLTLIGRHPIDAGSEKVWWMGLAA
jgi:6-phosphogluconolactonase (cycloisomerase 2 family)